MYSVGELRLAGFYMELGANYKTYGNIRGDMTDGDGKGDGEEYGV